MSLFTTLFGIAYPARTDPTDVAGDFKRMADTIETALSRSDSSTLSTTATATSTSNVTLHTSIDLSIDSPGTSAKFDVELFADVQIGGVAGTNIIECLVDGVAQSAQIVTAGDAGLRVAVSKFWPIIGLSEGSHDITFRTRNTTSVTITVNSGHTTARVRPTG
jgi:hypothetical protein